MAIQIALRNKAKESATILPANPKYLAISNNFGESNMQLTGSSPEMLVKLVNSGLLPKNARLVERKDLEAVVKRANNFFSGFYVDCQLNLDSRDSNYKINPVYAEALANDLKKVGINLKYAKLIPYNILTDVFRLSEKGKDIAKSCVQNTNDFKWDCMPSSSGLFRACLCRDGDWGARGEGLAYSDSDSMVVVVSGKATSQKILDSYASEFKKGKDKAISNVNKKYAESIAGLRVN